MRGWLTLLATLSLAGGKYADAAEAEKGRPKRPNILWLIAEDFGPELSCTGTPQVFTPNLDRMAAEGVRYSRAYTTAPVCSASRSAFMTGMYQTTIGAHNHRSHRDDGYRLPDGVQVLPDWFRACGYYTANVRKLPADFGFNGSGKTDWNFTYDGEPFDSDKWADLKSHQPFFAQINFQETHRKFRAPAKADPAKVVIPPYYPDHPVTRQDYAQYLDAASELDRKIGLILKQLEADGLADDTIVAFFGDHGQCHVRGKQFCYEEGLHIPLIVRWPRSFAQPKHFQPGTVDDRFVLSIDLGPTMLSLAGAEKPAKMEGHVFLGNKTDPPREYAFGARDRCDETVFRFRTVRDERYRYIRNFTPERPFLQTNYYKENSYPVWNLLKELDAQGKLTPVQKVLTAPTMPSEELYDLREDPHEIRNLAASETPEHQAVLFRLREVLTKWIDETNDQGRVLEPVEIAAAKGVTKPGSLPNAQAGSNEKPNIIVILSDDQGWGDLSVNGNTNLSTPSIDSLARDGALFDRFLVCPVCSPTRAEFLTGRYHPRGGVRGVSSGGERLDLGEQTIADTFKAAGYATAAFGKWHNGSQYPYHPNGRGFDEYYGFTSGHWGEYFDPPLEHNGRPVRGKGYITDDLTDHACQFIENNRNRPFFCYLPLNTPHSPMQVPDRFYDKFKNAELKLRGDDPQGEDLEHTRAALAMCENIDWNVGRVLKKLDDLRLAQRTIVVYFCDNGPNGGRWNGGMKGRKGSTDEGGVRSPLLIRWPRHIPAGTKVSQIAGAIDLLPTLAQLAGTKPAGDKPLDGVSVAPLLRSTSADWPDRMIFSHWNKNVSVRTQQYRLDAQGRLYDMSADPGQTRDIARDQPVVATRLSAAVSSWKAEVLAKLLASDTDNRPFPVGYREFPITTLPARDGTFSGKVQRSARPPNCSFFTNWSSPEDRIQWDVAVETSGRYEAVVYYTCAAEDVGATIELSFGESRLQAKVTEAYDPPLAGAEHDRVLRGESYVKNFKPYRLGTIQLQRGHGPLVLRAIDVPGKHVIEVRAISLTLMD